MKKSFFLNNLGLLFSAREKVLNIFKSRLLPTREPATEAELATTPEVATEPRKAAKATKPKTKCKVTDNPSIRIYVDKIENRITFKIKR